MSDDLDKNEEGKDGGGAVTPFRKDPSKKKRRRHPGGELSPRKVITTERRAQAMQLRARGLHFKEIGQELGVTEAQAHQLVRAGLDDHKEDETETAQELREIERIHLEDLRRRCYEVLDRGQLGAVDRLIKIHEKVADLYGLKAPERKELTGSDGGSIEVVLGAKGDAEI